MLSPAALIKGLVRRWLPLPTPQSPEAEGFLRLNQYDELFVNPTFPARNVAADEGAYFTLQNGGLTRGTAITFGLPAGTDPVAATSNLLAIANVDPGLSQGGSGKSIFVDFIEVVTEEGTAPTGTTRVCWAAAVDTANRTPSATAAGPATPNNVNIASPYKSIARVYHSNGASGMTTPAAGPNVQVVDFGYFKFGATVTGDIYEVRFGNDDCPETQQIGTAMKFVSNGAPFIIPPQCWGLFYLAMNNAAANNVTYEYRIGLREK